MTAGLVLITVENHIPTFSLAQDSCFSLNFGRLSVKFIQFRGCYEVLLFSSGYRWIGHCPGAIVCPVWWRRKVATGVMRDVGSAACRS